MDINYFDIIAGSIILLLGLKGIFNGFFKELFGLIGIVGGIFIASRIGNEVGAYLSKLIFHFSNNAAADFTGFIVTLALFWLVMIMLGYLFKKLSSMSGLGIIDRIFGFVFGASKFFLIAAIIAFAVNNVQALKPTLDTTMKSSKLFPVLVETGGYIMKIDPADLNASVSNATQKVSQTIDEKTKEITEKAVKEHINEVKKEIKEEIKEHQ